MNKELLIKSLRKNTLNMFGDLWYENTANDIMFESSEKQNGYVYFVKFKNSKAVKIGKTFNILSRLNALKNGSGDDLCLLGYIYCDDYQKMELKSHDLFKYKRVSGEWFNISVDEAIEYIISLNGVVANSIVGKKLNISDGVLLSSDYFSNIEDNLNVIFDSLERGVKLTTDVVIDKISKDEINNYSKKMITLKLKKYAEIKNIKYFSGKSNNIRWFILG
jgi:hypothetical protein